jgi:hypothetical protein
MGVGPHDSAKDAGHEPSGRVPSQNVEPLLQSLRATLANMDCEHEAEIAKLGRSTAPASVKSRVLAGINQRHRERREPYAHHLRRLQERAEFQAG